MLQLNQGKSVDLSRDVVTREKGMEESEKREVVSCTEGQGGIKRDWGRGMWRGEENTVLIQCAQVGG